MEIRKDIITDELLAAFLDGNVTGEQAQSILSRAAEDSSLMEFLSIAADVPVYSADASDSLCALAAERDDKLCAVYCERYVMQCFGISESVESLVSVAHELSVLEPDGTPLFNLGRLSEHLGLSVSRSFCRKIDDVEEVLASGAQLIAAVDIGELDEERRAEEEMEDLIIGPRPDHCVVILSYDRSADEVVYYDPASGDIPLSVPLSVFMDAWEDSGFYMISVSR